MNDEWFISRHHEWREKGWDQSTVICIDCGVETKIGDWDIQRCRPKWVDAHSGYKKEIQ